MKTKLLAVILSVLMLSSVFSGCSVFSNISKELDRALNNEKKTEQIDYHNLSNDEIADKVAKDFSTETITFVVREYENIYFINPKTTENSSEITLSHFDQGISIYVFLDKSKPYDSYKILKNALKSDLFGLSSNDQEKILSQFTEGTVYYEGNADIPFTIREYLNEESSNDYSRYIIFESFD